MTFTPTQTEDGTPAVCFCCGAEATGIGVGAAGRRDTDPRWLCEQCVAEGRLLYDAARRGLTPYEDAAVARAVDAVGPFIESHGTDLAEWDESAAEEFVRAIWQACGNELRAVIREGVPF